MAIARPDAAQLPPKIAVHPRPDASFVHAMPSPLRGDDASGDLVGFDVYERAGDLKYGEVEVGQETVIFDSDAAHK